MKYILILPFLIILLSSAMLNADTIYLKDGQESKGVVVEDYQDRIMLSTEKGEAAYFKKDIEKISYDTKEDNLVKLGAMYKDKGDYKTALYYYEVANKVNPNMKEAKEGISLVTNMIFREKQTVLEAQVQLKQDTEEKMGRPAIQETAPSMNIKAKELQEKTGILLKELNSEIVVDRVVNNSPAAEAGVKKDDIIVAVWGKLVKYMQLSDVYELLLNNTASELKITVKQEITLPVKKGFLFNGAENMIGGRLKIEFEGLTVDLIKESGPLYKAGVLKGNAITKINSFPTRYMPLESAYRLIEETKDNVLNLEIQKELLLWKKG